MTHFHCTWSASVLLTPFPLYRAAPVRLGAIRPPRPGVGGGAVPRPGSVEPRRVEPSAPEGGADEDVEAGRVEEERHVD
jgi:hypothetical protein